MKGPSLSTFAAGGAYAALHKYLSSRYADAVVLTFAQIEDLLGFPLPDPARLDSSWWAAAAPGATPSVQSQAWTLASRTAAPNLSAEIVLFERASF
jgi:hypothetical protein